MTKARQRQRQKARKALANAHAAKERIFRVIDQVDVEKWQKIDAKKTIAEDELLKELFGAKQDYEDWECQEVIDRLRANGVYRKIEEEESN
jgi:hypothetical protein